MSEPEHKLVLEHDEDEIDVELGITEGVIDIHVDEVQSANLIARVIELMETMSVEVQRQKELTMRAIELAEKAVNESVHKTDVSKIDDANNTVPEVELIAFVPTTNSREGEEVTDINSLLESLKGLNEAHSISPSQTCETLPEPIIDIVDDKGTTTTGTDIVLPNEKEQKATKRAEKAESRANKTNRRRLKYVKELPKLKTCWEDIEAEAQLSRNLDHLLSKPAFSFFSGCAQMTDSPSVPQLWNQSLSADEGKYLQKYDGVLHLTSDTAECFVPQLSNTEGKERHAFLSMPELRGTVIRRDSNFMPPWNWRFKYNEGIELLPAKYSATYFTSDLRYKPLLPEQLREQQHLVVDDVYNKLQDEAFVERCIELSSKKRTGKDSMTEQEREERQAPKDEYEVSDNFRMRDQFLPMMGRIFLACFISDVNRDAYWVMSFMVIAFLLGILEVPFRWIDHVVHGIFSRPPVNQQIYRLDNNYLAGADDNHTQMDEDVPLWITRALYQTVLSFFLLFLPWWAPNPHYLQ